MLSFELIRLTQSVLVNVYYLTGKPENEIPSPDVSVPNVALLLN